ncbi:tonsoku-like protein [Caerostris extrusa]|uniref:Tonsoku-like protein n=1 Tax=Caerostris extrusa TaxID=172846 RepID=A0AAV4PCE3_CAEEX|nr:tonsoku-like protein [Caerostris extrusa]
MTYKDMGDNEKALEYLDMEMNCYKDEPMEQVKTLWKSAEVLQEMGDVKQLERNYCRAVTLAQGGFQKQAVTQCIDCEGLTPLHDAAIVGHIDIMRLLISKGASVTACDDSGETPLQKLIRTRKENQDDLEPEDLQKCLEMEQELRQKMALAGQPAKDTDDEKVDTVHFNNFDFAEDCNVDCDNVRSSEKRARSSSLSSEQNSDDDIQSFINFSNGNQRHNWDGEEAKSEYQAVMSNLRQSAKSILLPCTSLSPTVNTKPALVCEDKNAHDWLINETNSVQRAKKKKKRKISQLPIRTSKSLYNYLTTEDNSGVENIKTLKNNNEECNVSHKTDKIESGISKNLTENDSSQTINKKEMSKLSFCIKVRITDKLILVPVPEDSCSIGWLAEQASQRYQDLMGCRPHLTLMTKDGALLSKVDLIKTLFNNNEQISSTVDFWDEPSIDERYVQLCTKRGLKSVPSIQKRLINFDTSPEINFSNCSILIPQTTIVFQVLQYYKNLQHLDISGTMLTDIVASEIISCFPSFVSLISLNMSCCCLTSGTLSNISQYLFQDISADAKLPCLKALILDYNIFQSNCVTDINIILQLSSLRILSLYSCSLIPTFFESTELIKTICNSSLEEFNIAGNTLSEQSLNNLVCSLPKKSLRKLDLSHTVQLGNSLTQQISNFLLADFPVLQEMSLEDCHLKDEDLLILTNRIRFCPQLKSLNISTNSDLSSIAILNFLEMLLNINNALTDIILAGTCSWHMENVSILINILSRSSNVNCIMLDAISKSCQEKLTEFWKNHWGTKASCFVNRFCKLSII